MRSTGLRARSITSSGSSTLLLRSESTLSTVSRVAIFMAPHTADSGKWNLLPGQLTSSLWRMPTSVG